MNENNMNLKIITGFFKDFALPFKDMFLKSFGGDLSADFDINLLSLDPLTSADEHNKDEYLIRKRFYSVGENQFPIFVLYPNQLIASFSDVATGGDGKVTQAGKVSELQINSCMGSLDLAFKAVQTMFVDNYSRKLVEYQDAEIVSEDSPDYNNCFDNCSYVVMFNVQFDNEISYAVPIVFDMQILKAILVDLKLIFEEENLGADPMGNINILQNAEIELLVELGRTRIPMVSALSLSAQSMIELDAKINDNVKIFANGVWVAVGEVVAVDEYYGVKITKMVTRESREVTKQ